MIIYKITNIINGMIYIGQTSQPLKQRWWSHISRANNGSKVYLHNAIRKYGKESFKVEIIGEYDTKEELNLSEIELIRTLNCKAPNGYNLNDGGFGGALGRIESEETRKKKSISHLGKKGKIGFKHTEESKLKMSINSAHNKPWLNKNHTEEYKNKMSEVCKLSYTEERRQQVSEIMKKIRAKKHWSTSKNKSTLV